MGYWLHEAGSRNGFPIDHLHRVSKKTNRQWTYSFSEAIQIAEKE